MSRCFRFPPPGYEKEIRNGDIELLAKEKHKEKKHKRAKKEKKKEGEERKDEERSEGKHKEKKDRKDKRKDKKKDKNREKDKNRLTDEKRAGIRIEGNNGEKIAEKGLQIEENGDSKFTAELLRRIRDEESCMGKQMVENFASTSQSRIEGTYGSNEKTEKKVDGKEKVKGKAGNEKKTDRHKGRDRDRNRDREENRSIRDGERCMESQMVENFAGTSQSKIEEIRRPKEDTEKRVDGKEKDKTGDKKKSDRHKGRDRERDRDREENRSKGKVKEKDKENEKEKEKVKEKSDRKHKEHGKHRESSKNDQINPPLAIKATVPTKDGEKISFFTAKDKKDQIDPPLAIKATVPTKDSEKISFFTAKDKKDQIDAPLAIKAAVSAKDNEKISFFTAKDKKDQIDAPLAIKAAVSAKQSEKLSFFTAKDKKDQIDAPLAIKAAVSAKDNEKISFFTARDKKDQIDAPLAIKAAVSAKDSEKISFFTAKDKKDQIDPLLTIKPTFPTRGSEKLSLFPANNIEETPSVEGNVRKRKDSETNGVFHDNHLQPSKLPRIDSSSHLQMENGRKVETGHRAIPFASERQAVSDNKKIERVFEHKERKINGKIEAQPLSINSRPAVCLETIENGGESSKRPHPDSQYLSQILSIPKTEEWSDFDDQDWLFGNDNNLRSKPKAGSEVDGGTPQVWEKTLRIESEDVYALPYVLPF